MVLEAFLFSCSLNYLTNMRHCEKVSGALSRVIFIDIGVHQESTCPESVTVPPFMNGLPIASNILSSISYTDDITITALLFTQEAFAVIFSGFAVIFSETEQMGLST